MYLQQLPDHDAPGFDEQAHFRRFSRHNMIFNAFSRQSYCPQHVGCLSIKTVLAGEEWYGIGNRQLAVRPGQFLILNDDQPYSCRIRPGTDTKVLSVFFQKEFAAAILRDRLHTDQQLVDDPFQSGGAIPEFFQTLEPLTAQLSSRLTALVDTLDNLGYDPGRTDEQLAGLLDHLIGAFHSQSARLKEVKAVKAATQKEIFRRLCVAKDILHSSFNEPIDLARLGRDACLSTPQLIRQFRAVYRVTPHRYLTAIRLRHAAKWLRETALPVQEITWRCGFIDASAFCRAFRSAYRIQPQQFRNSPGQERTSSIE